jgi:arylsulfatase A
MTLRPQRLGLLLLLLLFSSRLLAAPPNIIFILADDLGYGDLSCYGSTTITTPRIDRLAKEGIRFTDYYSASPFCSPSRAALLTGRLPARCGVPYVLFPAEHTGLPPEEVTLAEALKAQGYATICIGKWHLGWDKVHRPQQQGFDEFFGLPYSNDSNEWPVGAPFIQVMGLEPLPLMDGDKVVEAPVDQSTLTRRYTERAVQFIRQHRDRPFFLYLPHTMPHIPQYASAEFAGKSKGGLYGDVIEELDHSTGAILDTLKELKLDQNTIVVFTSDNGAALKFSNSNPKAKAKAKANSRFPGHDFGGNNGNLRAGKGTTFEGGVRVPCIIR